MKQEQKKEVKEQKKSGKVENYSVYPIRIAVFSGENGTNVKIEKTYKKDGQYETTTNFNLADLGIISLLINQVVADQTAKKENEF